MAENEEKQFELGRMYLKDASFESPMGAEIFSKKGESELNFNMRSEATSLGNDGYELALTATLTAKIEGGVAFLIEVKYAGQFLIKGFSDEERVRVLNITCPTILFPYLREVVDSLAIKGGMPPPRLQPLNFEARYEQQIAQQAAPPQH